MASRITLLVISLSCILVGGSGTALFIRAKGTFNRVVEVVGVPRVTPLDEVVAVGPNHSVTKQKLEFVIANRSKQSVTLEVGRTQCGCTGVALSEDVLVAGAEAVASLEVTPPYIGERMIVAEIFTDAPAVPRLLLRHLLKGDAKPPHVLWQNQIVNLPTDLTVESRIPVILKTTELLESEPWIIDASLSSNLEFLQVEAPVVKQEKTRDLGLSTRTYTFSLVVLSKPKEGFIDGRIAFFARAEREPVTTLSVQGKVIPAIRVAPSALHFNVEKGAGCVTKRVLLSVAESVQPSEIAFEKPKVPWLRVQKADGSESGLSSFGVTVDADMIEGESAESEVSFYSGSPRELQTSVRVFARLTSRR